MQDKMQNRRRDMGEGERGVGCKGGILLGEVEDKSRAGGLVYLPHGKQRRNAFVSQVKEGGEQKGDDREV